MEKAIIILEYEDKIAKNGKPYTRFKLDGGKWLTCFSKTENDKLKQKVGRNIVVNYFTSQKEGYDPIETIDKYVKDLDEAEVIDMTKQINNEIKQKTVELREKTTGIAEQRENRQWAEMAKEIYLAYLVDNGVPDIEFQQDVDKHMKMLKTALEVTKKIRGEFQ